MTSRNFSSLFPYAHKLFVGYENLFDTLYESYSDSNYPPYNIERIDDDTFVVELAVAGFSKDEIEITWKKNGSTLKIVGEQLKDTREFVHRGVSGRKFQREFAIGEYIKPTEIDLQNGMLRIKLSREIPDEMKDIKLEIK